MRRRLGAVVAVVALSLAQASFGNIAVDVDGVSGGTPVPGSNHGWDFKVNGPITVTHLGLWDDGDDGFLESLEVGLFRLSDKALLTSGTLAAGTGDPLTDHFRYVDVSDVLLATGTDYVVSYYTLNGGDGIITNPSSLTVDPLITIGAYRYQTGDVGLAMPEKTTGGDTRFGPNFMFTTTNVVPAPGALLLGGIGAGLVGWFRKRRSL